MARPIVILATLLLSTACTEQVETRLWGSGMLEADVVVVAPTIGGRLLSRPVEEGDRVTSGTVVAVVDSVDLTEARDQARVGLAALRVKRTQAETALRSAGERRIQAERERDRLAALVGTDAAPRARLEDAETLLTLAGQQVEVAETTFAVIQVEERSIRLQIASIERRIGECLLLAPLSGTVLTTFVEPGEIAAPGRGIMRIADLEHMFVRVYVPATLIGRVALGGYAAVRVDAFPERSFPGRVVHIAEEAEFTPKNIQTSEARADLVFAVKVAVPNPDGALKIGLPADVDLPEVGG